MSPTKDKPTLRTALTWQNGVLRLGILVSLALVGCGTVTAPTSHSSTPIPAPSVTAAHILDMARPELLSFREQFRQCRGQLDTTGSCAEPAYLELGITDPQELDQATLGLPYQIFELTPEMLHRFTPDTPVATLLMPGSRWLVPIVTNNEGRAGIEVDVRSGARTLFWYGGLDQENNLSRNLRTVHTQHTGKPGTLTLIKVHDNHHLIADLMLLTDGAQESLVILSSPPYVAPEVHRDLQPVPPQQLIPALMAAAPH